MCRFLPWKGIRFCTADELQRLIAEFFQHKGIHLLETDPVGYAVEVTLRYPEHLKEFFRQYPVLRYVWDLPQLS